MKTLARLGGAAALVLALAGCAGGAEQPEAASTTAPSATATATPESTEATSQLSAAELTEVFATMQFIPDEYADARALVDSIYPGLATSDPSCLTPFGVGWEAALPEAVQKFGTSADRSMTAVVSSVGDTELAAGLVAEATEALSRCAQGADLFQMQGQPVQTQLETFDSPLTGADESLAFRVTGDVGGSPFTLVGMTARVGGNVLALVGWDPASSEEYVPLAAQMFVDKL